MSMRIFQRKKIREKHRAKKIPRKENIINKLRLSYLKPRKFKLWPGEQNYITVYYRVHMRVKKKSENCKIQVDKAKHTRAKKKSHWQFLRETMKRIT